MSDDYSLAKGVFDMVQAVRAGEIDPLELRLTQAYRDLQLLSEKIDKRIDIDEMLNEILSAKVDKVQELARILAAPEVYVSRIKEVPVRRLSKMITSKKPVLIGHLEHESLVNALNRVVTLIDAMAREPPEDPVPRITSLPNGYALETEDSVFLDDLERFLAAIQEGSKMKFNDLVMHDEFESFLKNFLYVVILVSKGRLQYNPETREVWRPSVSDIEFT